ncbi:putative quinol monooxygenase [Emcibacter sp. SYSU 3D8]|uniref:putative quinol monooxygenase n=1 Tax=Emcibacter sp. SYSU 3D8 TaxID=3133969 RepID=UPI0031FE88C5
MGKMIAVIARVRARAGMAKAFEEMVTGVAGTVEAAEPGNVFYRAFRTPDPQVFVAIEVYADKAAHDVHTGSDHRARAAARVVTLLDGPIEAERLEQVW